MFLQVSVCFPKVFTQNMIFEMIRNEFSTTLVDTIMRVATNIFRYRFAKVVQPDCDN